MKNKLIIALKGFVFGIANIIPGVSGGTIALTMGIYEDLISSISNIFKKFKNSMAILIPFFIGAVLSIVLLSKIINFTLTKYPTPTIIFLGTITYIIRVIIALHRPCLSLQNETEVRKIPMHAKQLVLNL